MIIWPLFLGDLGISDKNILVTLKLTCTAH